jgi:hypothetical protein
MIREGGLPNLVAVLLRGSRELSWSPRNKAAACSKGLLFDTAGKLFFVQTPSHLFINWPRPSSSPEAGGSQLPAPADGKCSPYIPHHTSAREARFAHSVASQLCVAQSKPLLLSHTAHTEGSVIEQICDKSATDVDSVASPVITAR